MAKPLLVGRSDGWRQRSSMPACARRRSRSTPAADDQTAANYRQTVLTAFRQVEDKLAALRILSLEIRQQDAAVTSAQRYLTIATDRYRLEIGPYLDVIGA